MVVDDKLVSNLAQATNLEPVLFDIGFEIKPGSRDHQFSAQWFTMETLNDTTSNNKNYVWSLLRCPSNECEE